MSTLQETVLNAFPEPLEEDLSVWEVACLDCGEIVLEDTEGRLRAIQADLERGDASGVPRLAAMISNSWIVDEEALFYLMILYSEVVAGDRSAIEGIKGIVDRIEEKIESRRRDDLQAAAIGDWDLLLVYLREIWGSKTVAVLATLAGVSQSTVRRWLAGQIPSWKHKHFVSLAGQVSYALREDLGMTKAEVRDFFQEPLRGEIPLEIWNKERDYLQIPDGVRNFLQEQGALPPYI